MDDDGLCPHGVPPEFCGNCHAEEEERAPLSPTQERALAFLRRVGKAGPGLHRDAGFSSPTMDALVRKGYATAEWRPTLGSGFHIYRPKGDA